jgi:hypothetical protein
MARLKQPTMPDAGGVDGPAGGPASAVNGSGGQPSQGQISVGSHVCSPAHLTGQEPEPGKESKGDGAASHPPSCWRLGRRPLSRLRPQARDPGCAVASLAQGISRGIASGISKSYLRGQLDMVKHTLTPLGGPHATVPTLRDCADVLRLYPTEQRSTGLNNQTLRGG